MSIRRALAKRVCFIGLAPLATYFVIMLAGTAHYTVTAGHYGDFGLFYSQASRVPRGLDPYGPATRPGRPMEERTPNLNPPHFQLLMVPLAVLPPAVAFALWMAGSVAAYVGSLRLTFRTLRMAVTPAVLGWTLFATLASTTTAAWVITGQLGWLLMLPVTWAWVEAREGRWTRAAVALGIAASFKPFLWLFLPYLAVQRRWRACGLCLLAGGACYGIGLAFFGADGAISYLAELKRVQVLSNVINGSLPGFVQRLAQGSVGNLPLMPLPVASRLPVAEVSAAAVLLIALLTLWQGRRASRTSVDAQILSVLAAALLINPLGWTYYFVLLAGPVIAVARAGVIAPPLVGLLGVFMACQPEYLQLGQDSGWATATIGSLYFWTLVIVWAAALRSPDMVRIEPSTGVAWTFSEVR